MAKKKVESAETNAVSEPQSAIDTEKKKTPVKRASRKKVTKDVEETPTEENTVTEPKPKRATRKKPAKKVKAT